jgi:hypothetical protein
MQSDTTNVKRDVTLALLGIILTFAGAMSPGIAQQDGKRVLELESRIPLGAVNGRIVPGRTRWTVYHPAT